MEIENVGMTELKKREAQHTPGPWFYSTGGVGYQGYGWLISNHEDSPVCEVMDLANARLVAAAPELLAALKGLAAIADSNVTPAAADWAWQRARRIIAKAEGRAE